MDFITWMESKQFEKLIPKEVLDLVPILKKKAKELTSQFFEDNESPPKYLPFTTIKDPFYTDKDIQISFVRIDEWERLNLPIGQGISSSKPIPEIGDRRMVFYRIPMTDFDTIYHELVHAFDPKIFKGISTPKKINGEQNNTTPHEIEARMAGFIDIMKDKLREAGKNKTQLLRELLAWMKKEKSEEDLEPQGTPMLLKGMPLWYIKNKPKVWKKFITSVYAALEEFNASTS